MRGMKVKSGSAEETRRFGEWLSQFLEPRDVVGLAGELGAGKTMLVQGIGRGLGVEEQVKSPSFTIVNEYSGTIPLYHVDLYRISSDDFFKLGLEEYLYGDGVVAIEWADKIQEALPGDKIYIMLKRLNAELRELALTTEKNIDVGSWS
jgi:tRNA threonylcarbamoyladenosine biosynthesis protein TsaE